MIYIDADVLVYRVGFGCQNGKDSGMSGEDYSMAEVADILQSMVKNNILDRLKKDDHQLVISNSAPTFRHTLAKTAPYKGNRKAEKPKFYQELRDFIIDEMDGVMSPEGYEADDYIGCNVNKKTDIIVTIDKDLMMIPALAHYNFVKDELVKVKRPYYYFWSQMLTGDVSDNIIGLDRIGPKKAEQLLEGAKTKEMRKIVEREYQREFDNDWFKRFDENAKLLWIKRHYEKDYNRYV